MESDAATRVWAWEGLSSEGSGGNMAYRKADRLGRIRAGEEDRHVLALASRQRSGLQSIVEIRPAGSAPETADRSHHALLEGGNR